MDGMSIFFEYFKNTTHTHFQNMDEGRNCEFSYTTTKFMDILCVKFFCVNDSCSKYTFAKFKKHAVCAHQKIDFFEDFFVAIVSNLNIYHLFDFVPKSSVLITKKSHN
jgi:hypothetical protein